MAKTEANTARPGKAAQAKKGGKGKPKGKRNQMKVAKSEVHNAPVAKGRVTRRAPDTMKKHSVKGTGYLKSDDIPQGGLKDGEILYVARIDTNILTNSRVKRVAGAYSRFWYDEMVFTYEARAPTNIGGGVIIAFFDNPDVELPTDPVALKNMCRDASTRVATGNWWDTFSTTHRFGGSEKINRAVGLYTEPSDASRKTEPHWCYQGLVVVVVDGAPVGGVGQFHYSLTLDYNCQLWSPANKSDAQPGDIDLVNPLPGIDGFAIPASTSVLSFNPVLAVQDQGAITAAITSFATLMMPLVTGVYAVNPGLPDNAFTPSTAGLFAFKDNAGSIRFTHTVSAALAGTPALTGGGDAFGSGIGSWRFHPLVKGATKASVSISDVAALNAERLRSLGL